MSGRETPSPRMMTTKQRLEGRERSLALTWVRRDLEHKDFGGVLSSCQIEPHILFIQGLFGIVWGHQMSNSFRKTHQNIVISFIQLFCSKIQWCISLCLALCILQEVTNDPKHSLSLTQLLDCFSLFSRLILRCFNSNSWHDGSNLLCEQVFSYYLT